MNTIAKKHYIQFNGYDINGEYKVEIQRFDSLTTPK